MEDEDMGIENWMPLYTADVLASCADMSPAQFGSYMRLLCYAWTNGGLPNDLEACCRVAGGCTPADWSVVRKRLIVLDEGTSQERLSHPRLEEERAKAEAGYQRKRDAIAKARQSNPRNRTDDSTDHSTDHSTEDSTDNSPQLQPQPQPQLQPPIKNESPTEILGATPQKRRRTFRISWSADAGFQGVTDADLSRWKAAFPGVNLTQETARAHAWLADNPAKAGKRNYAAFLSRWFTRVQDKGGSGGPVAPQKSFRPDAGQAMTASEYAEWKRARDRDEYLKAKARKRTGGLTSLGEVIDGTGNP